MKKYLTLVSCCLLLFSCKTRKNIDGQSGSEPVVSAEKPKSTNVDINNKVEFYQNVLVQPNFGQLKIYSKVDVQSGQSYIPTLDATTYIEKDSKVWMNLSIMLISAARGLATPSGITAYSKLDRSYIDTDFSYLNNLLNTNFIDYKALEKILTGRTFVKINDTNFSLVKTRNGYDMNSITNQVTENDGLVREYKIHLKYALNFDLQQVLLQDVKNKDELLVQYTNWENFKDYRLPKNVKIIIKGSKPATISMENTKFESLKMNTPFSIPSNYKKIEI